MTRVVIFGSRGFDNYPILKMSCYNALAMLDGRLLIDAIIVSGGAKGADRLGERFAAHRGLVVERYIPDWSKGRGAGIKRNIEMADISQIAIGFWDGESPGTRQMIQYCKDKGLIVFVFNTEGKRVATYNVDEKYL